MDQIIDDIAAGFDYFTSGTPRGSEIERTLLGWGAASGTYQRVAADLRSSPPAGVPDGVVDRLADALDQAAQLLMASGGCLADSVGEGAGPEACQDEFDATSEANTTLARRLQPLIEYGSRSESEVLATFS